MRIITLPGVFRPISDSWLLADAVRAALRPGDRLLDVCTGSGVVAVSGAAAGAQATAIDVSRRAVLTARANGRLNGVRVRALRGSLFDPVAEERFHVISSNPPYVPSAAEELPGAGAARAWEAGRSGRVFLDQLLERAPRFLVPGGRLLVTHSDLIGEQETLDRMAAAGMEPAVVRRVPGPLGPLMRARVREGVLPAGTDSEEVLVIEGHCPG